MKDGGLRPCGLTHPTKAREEHVELVALSGSECRAVRHQRGRHLFEPQESDRAADGDRNDAAGGEHQLRGVLSLSERLRRTSLRVLHSDRGRRRGRHRSGDTGGAVPQSEHDQCRRSRQSERLMHMLSLYLLVPLGPLFGAIAVGLFGNWLGRTWSHRITIALVAVSFFASLAIFRDVLAGNVFNGPVYTWMISGDTSFQVGFLIDRLTVAMMLVVTFVSLMVHIYTIGYMQEDPGYQRFFSYISLFTFSMLMLVMANNFLQLFFGWEAVGLVSYLLIGFWYTRPTAIYANLKAFLVNRVGDFGFLVGIGLILANFGTLYYATVFAKSPGIVKTTIEIIPGVPWLLISVICICLFIGAMGKSAQVPLHVWLPESMEGPTPISALIHAATMVTAGGVIVARMSPPFEFSSAALSFVLVIGGITAFFMALIAVMQYDIKRVIAYSTLSQLGYMTVALGASAYSAAIFHLFTHAFFKAVLFLGAGSVLIAMHLEQDMRKMGGLYRYLPITWITSLFGSLALIGFPLTSGFFSKDGII